MSSSDATHDWSIDGVKDPQLVRSDWSDSAIAAINGVVAKQITNVLTFANPASPRALALSDNARELTVSLVRLNIREAEQKPSPS